MRFDQWERRLNATIAKYNRIPHEWGVHDCAMFAGECVWALTQKDPVAQWRRTYSDEAGAHELIAKHDGFGGLIEAALASVALPSERIAPAFAQRGDPCLMAGEDVPAIGICVGAKVVGKALTGLEYRPLSAATIVWAIR